MATDDELDGLSEEALEQLLMEVDVDPEEFESLDEDTPRARLMNRAIKGLFSDETFSGELLVQISKLGLSEDEMDTIFIRAQDELVGFVSVLSESGAEDEKDAPEALEGFLIRLKNQILKNPALYVEGS